MPRIYAKNAKKSNTNRRKYKKATKPMVSKIVKQYVKQAIHRQAENKIADNFQVINSVVQTYTPPMPVIYALSDAFHLSQGTGQGDRIGNIVQPISVMLRGHIVAIRTVIVRMILFRQKQTVEEPTNMFNFFQDGNTTAEPDNTPSDIYLPINRDDYIVYKQRIFTIGPTGVANENGVKRLNIFRQDLTKYVPKKLRYDDIAIDTTNCGLYMCFLFANVDGSPLAPGDDCMNLSFNVEFKYED